MIVFVFPVAPPSPLASVPQYVRPASVNLMPRNSLFNRYIVQWPQRTFNYGTLGQRAQGRGYFNNLRMLLRGYGNERSVVSSILGTNPYRGYYPGQMVRSSLISPGGGMFVSADGTDGSIMNADGSVTTVDGSDVSIDSGF